MSSQFESISKYAVAVIYGDGKNRLVTRQRKFSSTANTDNYVYQLSTYNEIDEAICTCDTLNELIVLMDRIPQSPGGLLGSAGEAIDIGYRLTPVVLTINVSDCSREISDANITLKRAKARAKLTSEDKLVLGIE